MKGHALSVSASRACLDCTSPHALSDPIQKPHPCKQLPLLRDSRCTCQGPRGSKGGRYASRIRASYSFHSSLMLSVIGRSSSRLRTKCFRAIAQQFRRQARRFAERVFDLNTRKRTDDACRSKGQARADIDFIRRLLVH